MAHQPRSHSHDVRDLNDSERANVRAFQLKCTVRDCSAPQAVETSYTYVANDENVTGTRLVCAWHGEKYVKKHGIQKENHGASATRGTGA